MKKIWGAVNTGITEVIIFFRGAAKNLGSILDSKGAWGGGQEFIFFQETGNYLCFR